MPDSGRIAATVLAASIALVAGPAEGQHTHAHTDTQQALRVPEAMRIEHEEIHGSLEVATRAAGAVGAAARELAAVLEPHFGRENQVALPPLSLLGPLSRGECRADMAGVLPLTDTLSAELPRMLEEHTAIAAAAQRLERTAHAQGDDAAAELARRLQLHARAEEEFYYPAAILVGELVRRMCS